MFSTFLVAAIFIIVVLDIFTGHNYCRCTELHAVWIHRGIIRLNVVVKCRSVLKVRLIERGGEIFHLGTYFTYTESLIL